MIDIIIVLAYLVIIFCIGIYSRSTSSGFHGYATIRDDTGNSKIVLVATIFASSIGGGTTFGVAEKAFSGNLSYTYGLLITVTVDLLVALYIVPRMIKHHGAESVGDVMYSYYGISGRIMGGLAAMIVSIGFVAAQISVSGRIFEYILEIDYIKSVILSYGIVIAYTTIGGLRSIMFTNLLQFFAMVIAIPIITIVGLNKIGLVNFMEHLPVDKVFFTNNPQLISDTIATTLGFAVMGLYPNVIQRILINKVHTETTKAIYIKSFIFIIFLACVTCNGLIAYQLYPEQHSNLSLTHLIDNIMPHGLLGIVVVGLLAAVMSTADSDLSIASITLVKDLFSPIFNVKNQHTLLIWARVINVLIGGFAILIALNFHSVVDLVVFIAGFWGPMILVPMIFALYGFVIQPVGMVLTSMSGALSFLLWDNYGLQFINLKGVFVGTVVSLLVFCICSIFMPVKTRKARSSLI